MQGLSCLPVFLTLSGKRVVLAGSSEALAWKAELCSAAGAKVSVFSPSPSFRLLDLAARPSAVNLILREIERDDFAGAALAIAEAGSEAEAAKIRSAARASGAPLNIIDKPDWSDFQFGSIVNRSPLVIGISTSGGAPVLAQALRASLEARIPRGLKLWAEKAKEWRSRLKALAPPQARRRFWELFARAALTGQAAPQEGDFSELLAGAQASPRQAAPVALVGAGPGDPELLTLKALRVLQAADAVLYDDLAAPAAVELARREALKIPVGKRGYRPSCRQEHIISLMVSLASQGKRVVRLKGGDPMIFGRANEEIAALRTAGVEVEVVPGVTAALGAAAGLQVSLTERQKARRVQFVTAHAHDGKLPEDFDWHSLCDPRASTAVYMGAWTLPELSQRLLANGMDPETPAVLVEKATLPEERRISGTIGDLPAKAAEADLAGPCVILIGAVFADAFSLPRKPDNLVRAGACL